MDGNFATDTMTRKYSCMSHSSNDCLYTLCFLYIFSTKIVILTNTYTHSLSLSLSLSLAFVSFFPPSSSSSTIFPFVSLYVNLAFGFLALSFPTTSKYILSYDEARAWRAAFLDGLQYDEQKGILSKDILMKTLNGL